MTLEFEVNETLLDLKVLDSMFERILGEPNFRQEWFSQLILYSLSITLANRYVPFGTLATGVLRMLGRSREIEIDEDEALSFVAAMGSLPAHLDVELSLDRLRAHGFRLVTLPNSSFTGTHPPTEAAGLRHYLDHNFGVGRPRKPAPVSEVLQRQKVAFIAGRANSRSGISQYVPTNPGRGITEREIHLRNGLKLFKGTEPPLSNQLAEPLNHKVQPIFR